MFKKIALTNLTLLLGLSTSSFATAASFEEMSMKVKERMACSSSCNSEYLQCLRDGSDYSFSAENIADRTKQNMMAPVECGSAQIQCNASC